MENVNVVKSMEKIADQIGGSFSEYSAQNVIITVPTNDIRFQSVTGHFDSKQGGKTIELMSKVCIADTSRVNFKYMLELNQKLMYAKVIIHDNFVQVAASLNAENYTDDLLRETVLEVSKIADSLEQEIIKYDIY